MSLSSFVFTLAVLLSVSSAAHSLAAAEPPITAAAFSPDGKSVVVGSQKGIEVRSWPALKRQRSIETKLAHVHHLAFSPDGKTLAAAGGAPREAGEIELHDWKNPAEPNPHYVHDDLIYQVAWSPDGSRLAAAGADGFVHLLNSEGDDLGKLAGHSRGVLSVVWLPDGQRLLSAGLDQSVRLWDAKSGELLRTLDNHTAEVRDLAVRPGEHPLPMVASASADRTVRLWQPTIGRLVRFARLSEEPLDIDWTPDGSQLLAACADGRLRVINPNTVEIVRDVPAIDGWAYTVVAAADGEFALIAGSHGQLKAIPLSPAK
jgi:WD40 repeat protein